MLYTNPKQYNAYLTGETVTDLNVSDAMDETIVNFIFEKVQNNEPLIRLINSIEEANCNGIELFDNSVTDLGYVDYIEGLQSNHFNITLVNNNQLLVTCELATLSIKINYNQTYILDFNIIQASNPSKYRLQEVYTLCKYLEDMRIVYSELYNDYTQID